MAVVKAKPTSPGRRFVVKVVNKELHKGAPHKPLLDRQSKTGEAGATFKTVLRQVRLSVHLNIPESAFGKTDGIRYRT